MVLCCHLNLVKNEKKEGLLNGDCVVSLLGVVMGAIIGILVDKPDSDKLGFLLVRILEIVLNT